MPSLTPRWFALLALVFFQQVFAGSYVVSTLAGVSGYGYKDGARARFALPQGVAVGPDGAVYVADTFNRSVRRIAADGSVSTVAGRPWNQYGDGPGDTAGFGSLSAIAVDAAGTIYVAELSEDTIRRIAKDGSVTTYAGAYRAAGSNDGAATTARFRGPAGLAVDGAGNVYVADAGNSTIRKITPTGTVSTVAGVAGTSGIVDGPASTATFEYPAGIAIAKDGTIYVADSDAATIRKISGGTVSTLAGSPGDYNVIDGTGSEVRFESPAGLAVDAQGYLWVCDFSANCLRRLNSDGGSGTIGSPYVPGYSNLKFIDSRFNHPSGVAADANGNVYVADMYNDVIRKLDTVSVLVTTYAGTMGVGSVDGLRESARLFQPQGMAYDSAGNLYFAETYNGTIRKMTPDGKVTTIAGSAGTAGFADGVGSSARFNLPHAVAVDGAGNVYVADLSNHTIRKITPAGVVVTLAGSPVTPGSADGVGNAARFHYPTDLKFDPKGDLIVTDSGNNTLRRVTTSGTVTTIAGSTEPGSTNGDLATARFYSPWALAIDAAGNMYVGELGNFDIRKITAAGVVSTLAGVAGTPGFNDGSAANARFLTPRALAVDAAGNVFVADSANNAIRQVAPDGTVTTVVGAGYLGSADGLGDDAEIMEPRGIAIDPWGGVTIADSRNGVIRHAGAVLPATPKSSIINLSVRVNLQANDRLITGFVVSGDAQPMLIRAIGPGLVPYVGDGTAGDPRLELYDHLGTLEQSNEDWGGTQALRDAFSRVGAFPIPQASHDAALLTSMTGLHSAHVMSPSGGLAIVEAYNTSDSSKGRLINVSARYNVGLGADALVAGFVIDGSVPKTVLIRGIGPTLTKTFGLSGSITDPILSIYNNAQQKIATSDDWDVSLKTTFNTVGAFGLVSHSKDAALLITLPPGSYSAQLDNADLQTGGGMIEVYDVGE